MQLQLKLGFNPRHMLQSKEAVVHRCSVEKVFLKACNFIKIENLARVFSCEFCEISKNTLFTEHLRWLLLRIANMINWSMLPIAYQLERHVLTLKFYFSCKNNMLTFR